MGSIAGSKNIFAVFKNLYVDCYFNTSKTNRIITVETDLKAAAASDTITDISISSDHQFLALITSVSKLLFVYSLSDTESFKRNCLPRSASKIRFTSDNKQILIADKSGDVYMYDIDSDTLSKKLLGHLSLLLDVLQTSDEKFIITCDRDEKIKVSCYPNTYNIKTFCLGHKEFVNHLEILPSDNSIMTSTSGDGKLKCWNYTKGTNCYTIDTLLDVNDDKYKQEFIETMDKDGIEVNGLPIVHYSNYLIKENSNLLALTVHSINAVFIYYLECVNSNFKHKLHEKIPMKNFPAGITFCNNSLLVYDDIDNVVNIYDIVTNNCSISFKLDKVVEMFKSLDSKCLITSDIHEKIKILFKRKFDNVQEYQERKKLRLNKP